MAADSYDDRTADGDFRWREAAPGTDGGTGFPVVIQQQIVRDRHAGSPLPANRNPFAGIEYLRAHFRTVARGELCPDGECRPGSGVGGSQHRLPRVLDRQLASGLPAALKVELAHHSIQLRRQGC